MPWRDEYDQSVFGVALANQDQYIDLECPNVRTGFATRVSSCPGLSNTINMRLEWHWPIRLHTLISTCPGRVKTFEVHLELPWRGNIRKLVA